MNSINAGEMVACIKCGHEIYFTAPMCPQCGASQRSRRYKSKVVAAVLAFFFGGLGIHRFYLGQWWGIFYLLLSWTAIPMFVALIEFIVFLVTDQQRWDLKYNEGKPAGPGEKTGGGLIAVLVIVGFFLFIIILGVVTAIAVPAYHDYTMRSRVNMAFYESASVRTSTMEYMLSVQDMPRSNADLGLTDPYFTPSMHQVMVTDGQVELVFMGTNSELDGNSIRFVPSLTGNAYEVIWTCSSDSIAPRLLPVDCRN